MATREFNFDGLVGPTHNYAGLSYGNVASTRHRNLVSNPKAAALQVAEEIRKEQEQGNTIQSTSADGGQRELKFIGV